MITGAPHLDAASVDATDPLVTLHHYAGPPHTRAADLITRARLADEEMSFTPSTHPTPGARHDTVATTTVEIFTTLHRWSAHRTREPRLAGVMTARTASGATTLDIVVAPEFRSTGVATAVVEHLLTHDHAVPAATAGTVVACAYGSHPAALRLSSRFGAVVRAQLHHLLLPSAAAYRASRLGNGPAGSAAAEPVDTAVHDGIGYIGDLPAGAARCATLRAAIITLFAQGAESIETVVESTDLELIELLRSAAFGHDHTDVHFHRSF